MEIEENKVEGGEPESQDVPATEPEEKSDESEQHESEAETEEEESQAETASEEVAADNASEEVAADNASAEVAADNASAEVAADSASAEVAAEADVKEEEEGDTESKKHFVNETESVKSENYGYSPSRSPYHSSRSSSAASGSYSFKADISPTSSEELRKAITELHPFLDPLSDQELLEKTEALRMDNQHLARENQIFQSFLEINEPSAIEGMKEIIDRTEAVLAVYSRRRSHSSRMSNVSGFSIMSGSMGAYITGSAPIAKINLTQKMDLVLREMEDMSKKSAAIKKKNHSIRAVLLAELEEMELRTRDLDITLSGIQKLSPEVIEPALYPVLKDKYLKFLRDCIYRSRDICDKMRLRASSLQVQYNKICHLYNKKLLIGENLTEVDFDNLRIQNLHLMNKIDQQGILLRNMKEMNGKANLMVSQHKQVMMEKEKEKHHVEKIIKEIEFRTSKMDDDMYKASKELKKAEGQFNRLEKYLNSYETPPVLDYIHMKISLRKLHHDYRIWSRKVDIKKMSYRTYINLMKREVGTTRINPAWYS